MTDRQYYNLVVAIVIAAILAITLSLKAARADAYGQTCGTASHYGYEGGRKTANGEKYDPSGMTAAHRTIKFGTILNVCNPRNGRCAHVRINDRGPFIEGRVIDVSNGVARVLGFSGLTRLCW